MVGISEIQKKWGVSTLILGLVLLSTNSWAATHTAASCSFTNVTSAISSSSNGDTVVVPAGSCSWSAEVSIDKSITLQGSGSDLTIISNASLGIHAPYVKITGFTFSGGNIAPNAENFRIYRNKFVTSGESITIGGVYGLIDSNTFSFSGTNAEMVKIYGPDNSWTTASSYGTASAVYVEENTFSTTQGLGSSQVVQTNYNGRAVVRYNTITNAKIDAHGIWSNGDPNHYGDWTNPTENSARSIEIYGNHFRPSSGSPTWWFSIELRGGTGIVFNNDFVGTSQYNNEGRPNVYLHDYCNVASDGNCLGYYLTPDRYPGRGQLGRGVNQTLEPIYLWGNTINGTWFNTSREDWPVAAAITQYGRSYTADEIVKKNRDYYEYNSSFSGTTGVGIGTMATRPATCTTGVGYWATDQGSWNTTGADGVLFKCTSTNTWTQYYTPYIFPHPLRNGELPSPTLTIPQGLKVVP